MSVCPCRKRPRAGGAERAALTRRPFHCADVLMGLLSFQNGHLSVTDDVVVPATATATVLLFLLL